jgi:hypothetical protein
MGGQVQPQSASFAKGKYYVEIVVNAADPNVIHTAELQALVDKMAHRIEGRETAPEALAWFPQEDLTSSGLVPESVLGLKQLKRGYVAKYKQGQAFIVLEESPESAAAVLKDLRARFDRGIPGQGAVSGWNLHLSQGTLSWRICKPAHCAGSRNASRKTCRANSVDK